MTTRQERTEKKGSILSPFKAVRYLFKKPRTLRYPFEPKEPALRYRGFHLNAWEKCTGCGNCADICPNEAINMVEIPEIEPKPGEKNERPKLDYGFTSDLEYSLFEPERVHMPEVQPDERKLSFIEQVIGYSKEEAKAEASRCLECKLCEEACPAHLKISDYIKAIYENKPGESLKKIFEDNPIPSICGRICMKHCEAACSLSIRGEALAVRWLKRFAADSIKDYKTALELRAAEPTGKKVAVIGAGPSGLSVAYFLTLKGHKVVVFDSLPGGGGMMRIGPPLYRLPIEAIDKDVNYIASLGVEFRFSATIGKDILFEDILKEYDAIYLGIGTIVSRSTRVKNIDKAHLALPFLQANKIAEPVKVYV